MMGVPPQMLMMMKYQQETGQTPPALQEGLQNMMTNKMQQAAANAGIYQRQQAEQEEQPQQNTQPNPDPGAPENAGLSTQQFIQRLAPQPNAASPDRRDGAF